MTDQDERETTDTLAPPTDREAPTNPANEKPAPRVAIAPAAPANPFAAPPPWWEGSFFQSTFNRLEGGFEAVSKAMAGQSEILAAIEKADKNNTSGWETTQAQIRNFRQELVATDAELKALRAEIEDLKAKVTDQAEKLTVQAGAIEKLEKRLDEKQANAQRPATTPPAEPT